MTKKSLLLAVGIFLSQLFSVLGFDDDYKNSYLDKQREVKQKEEFPYNSGNDTIVTVLQVFLIVILLILVFLLVVRVSICVCDNKIKIFSRCCTKTH